MSFGGIVGFGFLQRFFLAPAQDERTTPAALHSLVNFLPESPEVIDGGNDGDANHKPDGHFRYQVNRQHEREGAEMEGPYVPAYGQDGGNHGDDLHHHLELAQLAGFNGEAL